MNATGSSPAASNLCTARLRRPKPPPTRIRHGAAVPYTMKRIVVLLVLLALAAAAIADDAPAFAPDRKPGEGDGPFDRLIIRGATLIDGTGAPPIGPVDIVIEKNRIREIRSVGYPKVPIKQEERPKNATKEIDASTRSE